MIELNNLILSNAQNTATEQSSSFNKVTNDKEVYIETYGCQMNFSDTEIVLSVLSNFGYNETSDINDSDVILVNTCAIRDNAEQRVYKRLDDLKKFEEVEKLDYSQQKTIDRPSPSDWIKKGQIFVHDDEVIIKVKNPEWAVFADTKSMDPVIDSTSKAIEIIPKSEEEVHVGDIVAYKSKYSDGLVTHRVFEIDNDFIGWYAILKGDNNDYPDPGKVRFEQIKRLVVAIIY